MTLLPCAGSRDRTRKPLESGGAHQRPRPVGARRATSPARRLRSGGPGGLCRLWRCLGRLWRTPASQLRGLGALGNPSGRRRGARGAVGARSRAAGGAARSSGGAQRRRAGGRRGCPARVSWRCVALKRQRERQRRRRRRARPWLRGGAGGGDGGAGSSLGPGEPGPNRRPREASAQRPGRGPSPPRPAPGACLPGWG